MAWLTTQFQHRNPGVKFIKGLLKFIFFLKQQNKNFKIYVANFFVLRSFSPCFWNCFIVSLLRNHNLSLRNDHNSKINVLPQLVVPSILSKFSRTKAKSLVKLDVYGFNLMFYFLSSLTRNQCYKTFSHSLRKLDRFIVVKYLPYPLNRSTVSKIKTIFLNKLDS